MKMLFINARIITPYRILPPGWFLEVTDGKITMLTDGPVDAEHFPGEVIDAEGCYLSPGFIDMHTHGAGGHDFMDGTLDATLAACRTHMHYGTTSIVPTTLSSQRDELVRNLTLIDEAAKITDHMPNILGSHLEGPYFSPAQYGAQDMRYLKNPDPKEYLPILEQFPRILKWTLAPELDGAMELGRILRERGVIASIGHSDATENVVENAIYNGYTMVTHLYNATSRLTRKNALMYLGVAESTLVYDELTAEIIADGCHLPPSLLKLIYKCKGPQRLCLVTDSMRAAGTECTESILGSLKDGQTVEIADGVAFMPGRRSFGGSIATADRLVRTMYRKVGIPLEQAVEMMTMTPARMLNVLDHKGVIEIGKDADLILFDEDVRIKMVMVGGNLWENHLKKGPPSKM